MHFFRFLILTVFLGSFSSLQAAPRELRSGDILLLPMNCYLCSMIEGENNSIFSHSGVFIQKSNGEFVVLEAYGKVKETPFLEFRKRTEKGQRILVLRPTSFIHQNQAVLTSNLLSYFQQKFQGLPFDSAFLWDNFDSTGKELIYCSELVAKLLNHFLPVNEQFMTRSMNFSRYWSQWESYFRGSVPQGKPGIAPEDLRSGAVIEVGEL